MRLGRSIVALVVAGLLAPAAAHAVTITVVAPNGQQTAIPWDGTLQPDVDARTYTIRSAQGTSERSVAGVSLRAVLERAGAFVDQFRAAEVVTAAGTGVSFSRRQTTQTEWKGGGPPVFYRDTDGLHFLRASSGPGDRNAEEELVDPVNLTVRLRQNAEITLRTTVSDKTPRAGEEIAFETAVSGAGAGEEVGISWRVAGRRIGTGERLEHAFRKPGTYVVLVTATAGDVYGSDTVTLTVGEPKAAPQPEQTTTTTETPPAPAASAPPPATGDPGVPGGTGSAGATGGATAAPEPAPKPDPEPPEPQAADALKPGELRGQVIETVPEPVQPVTPAVVKAAPDEGDGGTGGNGLLPPAAWTGIGVCLFLLAGWGLERTGWRPRPWHRGVAA